MNCTLVRKKMGMTYRLSYVGSLWCVFLAVAVYELEQAMVHGHFIVHDLPECILSSNKVRRSCDLAKRSRSEALEVRVKFSGHYYYTC
jgi:hypothetical protein